MYVANADWLIAWVDVYDVTVFETTTELANRLAVVTAFEAVRFAKGCVMFEAWIFDKVFP
jgi:hypothetical protein